MRYDNDSTKCVVGTKLDQDFYIEVTVVAKTVLRLPCDTSIAVA